MAALRRARLTLLCGLASCGRFDFGFDSGSTPDAMLDAAPTTVGCAMPATVHDSFDVGPPCGAWGTADTAMTTLAIANGELLVTSDANIETTRGGCLTDPADPMPFDPDVGLFIQLGQIGDEDEYITLQAIWSDNELADMLRWGSLPTPTLELDRKDQVTEMATETFGTVGYDSATSAWARMRPSADRTAIVAEYSADGQTWHQFAMDPTPAPTGVQVQLYAGTFTSDPSPAVVGFESLNTCP